MHGSYQGLHISGKNTQNRGNSLPASQLKLLSPRAATIKARMPRACAVQEEKAPQ